MALFVVEGVDGVGKTEVALSAAMFLNAGVLPFPNDACFWTGKVIRSYLRRDWSIKGDAEMFDAQRVGAIAFQALQMMNRLASWDRLVAHEGIKSEHLVLVRYWQSGLVYGQLDNIDGAYLERIHKCLPQARVNVLLDAPAEVCLARCANRDSKPMERYEGRVDVTMRVRHLYRELWQERALEDPDEWVIIDAQEPLSVVVDRTVRAFRHALPRE